MVEKIYGAIAVIICLAGAICGWWLENGCVKGENNKKNKETDKDEED